jgi:putative aminopeptidase FrvX
MPEEVLLCVEIRVNGTGTWIDIGMDSIEEEDSIGIKEGTEVSTGEDRL